jgi:hypothetical protein
VTDHRSDVDSCEEIDCEKIISRGDATEVLPATERALDGVALRIAPFSLDLPADGISVVAFVAVQDRRT